MIVARALACQRVDFRLHDVADVQGSRLERAVMSEHIGLNLLRVGDCESNDVPIVDRLEHAFVADLPARFRIKRRRVQYDDAVGAGLQLLHRRAFLIQRDHLRIFGQR